MLQNISHYKFSIIYVLAIASVSLLFVHYPLLITVTDTVSFSPWSVLVGFWFVLRDFSQRELGHKVFIPMGIGIFLSFLTSASYALAGVCAGIASELTDWAIYTFTKKPFHQRVLLSSLASGPVDSLIFFAAFDYLEVIPGVSIFNWPTIILASGAKIIVALIVVYSHKQHQKRLSPST